MMRSRWQIVAVWSAASLGVAALGFALWLMTQDAGPGEVSVVLHGAAIVLGLTLALVCVGIALWFWFWRFRLVRCAGLGCVAAVALWGGYGFLSQHLDDRADPDIC